MNIDAIVKALPKIEMLNEKLTVFSPFRVLNIEDFEIRHSNILGWLLSSEESHNLGPSFLKIFLQKILTSGENELKNNREEILRKIVLNQFKEVNVSREHKNIDLLIESEIDEFVCLIENKFYSKEHSNQLERYLKVIDSDHVGQTILPIYLTMFGDSPSNERYFVASYLDIISSLEMLLDVNEGGILDNVRIFIAQYIIMLKEKTMSDPKLKNIASKIYRENKDAIDYIYSVGNDIDISICKDTFFEKNNNLIPILPNSNWFSFIDKRFDINNKLQNDWAKGNPVQLWFAPYNGKLKLCIEVGPFDVGADRLEFLLELEKNGVKLRDASKIDTGTYTRLWTNTTSMKDWSDDQELFSKMQKLYSSKTLIDLIEIVADTILNFKKFG